MPWTTSALKAPAQRLISRLHLAVARRHLPPTVSVFAHEVRGEESALFAAFLGAIIEQGFSPAAIDEYLANPEGRLLVSFDDSFENWLELLPVLEEVGVEAVFYVNTLPLTDRASRADIDAFWKRINSDGRTKPLSSSKLKELHAAGHTIGCHGHAHLPLGKVPFEDAVEDLRTCRLILEEILDEQVLHFSHPYGFRRHFSSRLRRWLLEDGYRSIAHGEPGMLFGSQGPEALQRTYWRPWQTLEQSLAMLRVDGRLFTGLTRRSCLP